MISYTIKKLIVGTSLLALATAFEIVSKWDEKLRTEIEDWEEGRIFSLGVMKSGPAITLQKTGIRIRYLGHNPTDADPKILFKNMDCALLPLTGMMSADVAFVQHRAILHGRVSAAMEVSRAMGIVQGYLLPGFMFGRLYKRPPTFTGKQYILKAWVLTTLLPCMAVTLLKRQGGN